MDRPVRHFRHWCRWLHLARGVPVEHVARVFDRAPSEVESALTVDSRFIAPAEADRCRSLRQSGLTYRKIAAVVGRNPQAVWLAVNRGPTSRKAAAGPPVKRARATILGQAGPYVRRLAELGYTPERIAALLVLEPPAVSDFLKRTEPLRRPRASRDRLTRPRTRREERNARLAIERAADRRRDDQVAPVDERTISLRLQRSTVDDWGPRGYSTEIADYARLQEAIRSGRLSGTALLELAYRVHYAPPKPVKVEIETAIWTGAEDLRAGGPIKLTAMQILEAADLLHSGAPWGWVAKRFGVSENTLRRYIAGTGTRHAARYPTEAVHYKHGTVRWDLPLGTARDGVHRTVLVECECGRQRRVWTSQVTRPRTTFNGRCDICHRRDFKERFHRTPPPKREPVWCACGCGRAVTKKGAKFVKGHHRSKMNAADAREARRMHQDGMTNREIAAHYGMSEHGMYKILSGRTRVFDPDFPTPPVILLPHDDD